MHRHVGIIVVLLAICGYFTAHARTQICSPWWSRRLVIHNAAERRCLELFVAGLRCADSMRSFERELCKRTPEEIFPAFYGPQAYYGDDDNEEPFLQLGTLAARKAMNVSATAVIIHSRNFVQHDDIFILREDTLTLGEQGLCCGQHRRNDIAIATCTAFLIAPDTLVSARHCFRAANQAQNFLYVFGFVKDRNGNVPRRFQRNVTIFEGSPPRVSCDDGRKIDWAVIKLKHTVPDTITPMEIGLGMPKTGDAIYMISSPLGVPLKLAGNAKVRKNTDYGFFVTNLDGFTSSSGAAVFSESTDKVEGIYVRGEISTQEICGCTRATVCPNDGCRGEDVTRISLVPTSTSVN
jgi:hypothetical protein